MNNFPANYSEQRGQFEVSDLNDRYSKDFKHLIINRNKICNVLMEQIIKDNDDI